MKKAVSVLFSMMLVGFLVMTSGAIAEEAPESSSNEEVIFGSASEGSAALEGSEDSEISTRPFIEDTEIPKSESPNPEEDSPLTGSSEEQESAPSDSARN